MKQIYIFSLFSLLCITNLVAQTTFDWENSTDNGATIEQTVNTITATFTVSSSDPLLTNASGFAGSSGFAALSSRAYVDTNAIITFSSPINVTSLFAFNGDSGGPDTYWTFIPSGGTNSNVVAYIPGAYGVPVALNWTNITQIEITSASASGTDWFGFDNIVSDFNLSTTCTVNIPDANFKAYLVGNTAINTNGDTEIQCSEATAFNGIINCASLNISDLTGVEAFTALTELTCHSNQLTSLDLSANTALTSIDCRVNQLTSINLPSSTALTELNCGENQITSLDVSANTALTELNCYTNQLTSLDVSSNTALTELDFDTNPITSIDVSANTALVRLAISRTQLTSIDVSTNTALEDFFATDCLLTSLDVSAQPNLVLLWCNENQLTSLNIANGNNANMASFYATDNTALTCIEVDAAIAGTSPTDWFKDAAADYSVSCGTLRVDDFSLNTVSIYPNPATSVLHIEMAQSIKQVTVYSMLGKAILSTKSNTVDVSGLSNGLYVINIEAENGNVSTKRFIKK